MRQPNTMVKAVGVCLCGITITTVVFGLLLSSPSCSKKNAEADITIYEVQIRGIEHLIVCLDHCFAMMPEQANSKQRQASMLGALLNITLGHSVILNDKREGLGKEQRLELTKMSKRLDAVHEGLRARFKAIRGKAGEQRSDITNKQAEQDAADQLPLAASQNLNERSNIDPEIDARSDVRPEMPVKDQSTRKITRPSRPTWGCMRRPYWAAHDSERVGWVTVEIDDYKAFKTLPQRLVDRTIGDLSKFFSTNKLA